MQGTKGARGGVGEEKGDEQKSNNNNNNNNKCSSSEPLTQSGQHNKAVLSSEVDPNNQVLAPFTISCTASPPRGAGETQIQVQKQTNKSVKENPKFCSRTQRLGFQREVQPVQLPATASSRWSTTSHHGRLHLQRRQVLTTYPLRCKSSWYFPKKDSYSRHFCQKVL